MMILGCVVIVVLTILMNSQGLQVSQHAKARVFREAHEEEQQHHDHLHKIQGFSAQDIAACRLALKTVQDRHKRQSFGTVKYQRNQDNELYSAVIVHTGNKSQSLVNTLLRFDSVLDSRWIFQVFRHELQESDILSALSGKSILSRLTTLDTGFHDGRGTSSYSVYFTRNV